VLFLLLLLMSGASATAQVHDVHYQGNLTPLNTTPTFDHGYLVVYDWDHDRHVLAVACRADYLVTFNLKDFASPSSVVAIGPSAFLKQLAHQDRDLVEERLHQQAAAIGVSRSGLLDRLASSVPGFVSFMRKP
jgi:hypothetical protein